MRNASHPLALTLSLLLAAFGCGGGGATVGQEETHTGSDGGTTVGNGGNGSGEVGGGAGGGGGGGGPSFPNGTCENQVNPLDYAPKIPDVLIAFDRSGSMYNEFGSGTRFSVEVEILKDLVADFQDKVRFGFEQFPKDTSVSACDPNGPGCCADPVSIEPSLQNGTDLHQALDKAGTGSATQTPTGPALRACREFYQRNAVEAAGERYVLLSTDGQPNCSATNYGNSNLAADEAVNEINLLRQQGIKTIVLGVSEDSFGTALERMAVAGGAPRPGGNPSYYPASNPEELRKQLEAIIGTIAKPTCFIDLVNEPADRNLVSVHFDGVEIPKSPSHADGWDYESASSRRLVVYGPACTKLESFGVQKIEVFFGCAPVTIN